MLASLTAHHLLVSPLLLLNNYYILNCPSLEYGGETLRFLYVVNIVGGSRDIIGLFDYYVDTEYGLYILWVVYSESLRPFQLPFFLFFGYLWMTRSLVLLPRVRPVVLSSCLGERDFVSSTSFLLLHNGFSSGLPIMQEWGGDRHLDRLSTYL